MLKAALRYPLAHWRGDIPLLPTILGSLLGLRLVLLWAIPMLPFWSPAVMAADMGVFVWQATGTLRAIARQMRTRPSAVAEVSGFAAVAVAFLVSLPPHLDRIAGMHAVPPPQRPPEFSLVIDGATIRLSGPISFSMSAAFAEALEQGPGLATLELDSPGGRVIAARSMARLVRERGLDTLVNGDCASACTLVFVAGAQRRIGPGARLGFHGYQHRTYVQLVDVAAEEEKDRAAFLDRGVDPGFVARIFRAGPDEMWFPDHAVLLSAGLATGTAP